MNLIENSRTRQFCINLALAVLGTVLFTLSFPNLLVEKGLPLAAWIAWVPVFLLINRVSLPGSILWGVLYGYGAYSLFNYWMGAFHPLAGLIINSVYMVYLGITFFFLKLAGLLFRRRFYLVQWCIWLAYEYLRTLGFLGYPYGISGYSQWELIPVIQIAGLAGVWAVSALVTFPSAWLGAALKGAGSLGAVPGAVAGFFRRERVSAVVWLAGAVLALGYGFVSLGGYDDAPLARIALIQHNTDPWRGDMDEYRQNFRVLSRLSDEALRADPKPDMVVWSETAFVPRIYWHSTYRDDPESWDLVRELLAYLSRQDVPFVLGNDDARLEGNGRGGWERVDYNAVLLFEGGEISNLYRKLHLVPFTEYFPYQRQLPWVYELLINADTHLWEKGKEAAVFSVPVSRAGGPGTLKFSTPICFEDTFGYLSRKFVQNGAELIVNLTNDAWSHSLPAQNQHLSMAVFRAVENRRSMVRSTASGQTCGINPNGRVIALAPPFAENWITVEVPVLAGETPYMRFGDYLGIFFVVLSAALLIFGAISRILSGIKK
ncbi:MAG: apolipoprotein N-acyltransferase [Treponema sp.]|jgi:apolipoprotein N-acyltransferase|nr:apolipoprotein N-acyltransferase [Treponema sp.]